MATVESGAKRKRRKRDLQRVALIAIGAAGLIAVSTVAPNMFQLLGKTGALSRLKYRSKGVLSRLKQKGEITFEEIGGKRYIRLTEHGEDALALSQQRTSLAKEKPRKWDHRYRLVMFDIPEKRKKSRERLRFEMEEVGFLRVQDSAWLYPYDCEEFMTLLKADMHIGKDVLYAVVEEIDNDGWIRKHFSLPLD